MEKLLVRLCLLVFTSLTSSVFSFGQTELGVRTGLFFAKFRYFHNDEHFLTSKAINGIDVGLAANFSIKKYFSLHSELNFLQKGGKVEEPSAPSITTMNQLELAELIRFKYKTNIFSFFANAGLFYGHFLNGKSKSEERDLEQKLKFENPRLRRSDFGYLLGAGVGCKLGQGDLILEGRYRHSLIYTTNAGIEDHKFSLKNAGIGVCIGYNFRLN